jgi:exonuclease VII large subunit
VLTKEERQQLKQQDREYQQKVKEHREELKQLSTERKKQQNTKKKDLRTIHRHQKHKPPARQPDRKKILSVFPVREYDSQNEFFLTDRNSIINLFQIRGRSFYDASDEEIENMVYENAKFLQKYMDDFKIIGMNYPTNTRQQQKFLLSKLKKPELEKYQDFLQEQLEALKALEQTTTDRQAFLMVFAKDKRQYMERLKLLRNNAYFHVDPISAEKKENILFQLNNMNKQIKV